LLTVHISKADLLPYVIQEQLQVPQAAVKLSRLPFMPFNSTPSSNAPVGDYKALATLNDTENGDEDFLLLDWSSLPDPLPPFIVVTHVLLREENGPSKNKIQERIHLPHP
jgi:hypothetical protein